MIRKLWPAMLAVFAVSFLTGFLFQGVLLSPDYRALAEQGIYGGQALFMTRWPMMLAAYLAFGIGSVWIYARGVEDKPALQQGLRFGVAMWLLYPVTSYLIQFSVQRIPPALLAKQLAVELVDKLLLGCLIAVLVAKFAGSKPASRAQASNR